MLADTFTDSNAELMTTDAFWCFLDKSLNYLHGVTTVAFKETVTPIGLRSGAINDSDEVRSDDDSVLAFYLWVLRNDVLFYNFHCWVLLMVWDRGQVNWGIADGPNPDVLCV